MPFLRHLAASLCVLIGATLVRACPTGIDPAAPGRIATRPPDSPAIRAREPGPTFATQPRHLPSNRLLAQDPASRPASAAPDEQAADLARQERDLADRAAAANAELARIREVTRTLRAEFEQIKDFAASHIDRSDMFGAVLLRRREALLERVDLRQLKLARQRRAAQAAEARLASLDAELSARESAEHRGAGPRW